MKTEPIAYPNCEGCGKPFNPDNIEIVNDPSRKRCLNCLPAHSEETEGKHTPWIYEPHPTQVNVFDVYDSEGTLYFGLPEKVAKDFCDIHNSYSALKAENEQKDKRIQELEAALSKVAKWETPETGKFWNERTKDSPMSYEAAYGSNGVRDYFKALAKSALTSKQ